ACLRRGRRGAHGRPVRGAAAGFAAAGARHPRARRCRHAGGRRRSGLGGGRRLPRGGTQPGGGARKAPAGPGRHFRLAAVAGAGARRRLPYNRRSGPARPRAGAPSHGSPMSIKSARWIRRMSEGPQRMIEPFEPGQVKQAGGERIVSYGTSSYGYDVRCSREFKVFTNINSTIVDPKHFDPKSFVDIESDVCIIPPNSFALARTVEYFRIPRDTLVVCLGKSTYARCGIIVNVT